MVGAGRARALHAHAGFRRDDPQRRPAHPRHRARRRAPAGCSGSWTRTSWSSPVCCCRWARSATGTAASGCCWSGSALFGASPRSSATYATSTGTLIAARALMGLGAAILTPIATGDPAGDLPAGRAWPRRSRSPRCGMGIGVPLGPIIGGWLLRHFWWGSVFLVNVPVVVIAIVAALLLIPESQGPARPARPTSLGGVLSTVGLVSFVYGVIEAPRPGLGQTPGAGPARTRGRWCCRRVRAVGAAHGVPDDRSAAVRPAALPVGHRGRDDRPRSPCSACCSCCRSTCRRCSARRARHRAAAAADDGRPDRRRQRGRTGGPLDRHKVPVATGLVSSRRAWRWAPARASATGTGSSPPGS